MCEMEKLRVSVEQILTAAADEIFGVFKRSIAELEDKLIDSIKHNTRNHRLPEAVHQTVIPERQRHSPQVDQEDPQPPHIKEDQEEEWLGQERDQTMKLMLLSECPTLIQKLWMVKEEPPLEQQERSPSPDQMDPEPPHTKEEESMWTNQGTEQLQGLGEADITKFPSIPPCVKSEYDEDKAQSSQVPSQTDENKEEPEDIEDFPISEVASKTQPQCTEAVNTPKMLSVSETQTDAIEPIKIFNCSVCNKGFSRRSTVNHHMLIHTGEKPFSCSVCKKGFAHRGNLNHHMLVHTGEKPFSCSVCKKGFSRRSRVTEHMSIHTGEKPFSCSVCEKGFAHKSDLKKHMFVHTGDKPFNCAVCKKGFARKCLFMEHMLNHTGEKPFSCSVCKKGFAHKRNLKRHYMLTHSGKKGSIQ